MKPQEHKEKGDQFTEDFLGNLRKELMKAEISQKALARDLGISESSLSRALNQTRKFSLYELNCIKEQLDISYEKLFTGGDSENKKLRDETRLNNDSINWLKKNEKEHPEYLDVLNLILNDDDMAKLIFKALYMYLNRPMIKIEPVMTTSDKSEIDVKGTSASREIIRAVSTGYLYRAMDIMFEKWFDLHKPKFPPKFKEQYKDDRERLYHKYMFNLNPYNFKKEYTECEQIITKREEEEAEKFYNEPGWQDDTYDEDRKEFDKTNSNINEK